ncbi:MAG: Hsp20/alpha crystallin family protein [Pseudomonadota bacterium]
MRAGGLIPWRRGRQGGLPFSDQPLNDFERDWGNFVDRFFDRTPDYQGRLFANSDNAFGAIDVAEKDDAFSVKVDLPGVEDDDIDLELVGNRLTIHAKREREDEFEREGFHQVERAYGTITRNLVLPDDVEAANVKASFMHGVLSIDLPKSETAKGKTLKIPVSH